jgi:endonuclease YncB( thermonuclease family)
MKSINMFVLFALCSLTSLANAQEKKDEPKDVTAEVQKWIDGDKLQLGGKASNRHIVLDDKMTLESATRKGKELVIVIKVAGQKQHVNFVNLDGLIKATYDPNGKKGKTHEIGTKGRENFQQGGDLTVTIPDEKALAKPAAAPGRPFTPKGKKK